MMVEDKDAPLTLIIDEFDSFLFERDVQMSMKLQAMRSARISIGFSGSNIHVTA
jgi:hypothetical protein